MGEIRYYISIFSSFYAPFISNKIQGENTSVSLWNFEPLNDKQHKETDLQWFLTYIVFSVL